MPPPEKNLSVPIQPPVKPSDSAVADSAVRDQNLPPDHENNAVDFKIDDAAQALIGHHLRTLYSEIVREPVPDQLLQLLHDLERKEQE